MNDQREHWSRGRARRRSVASLATGAALAGAIRGIAHERGRGLGGVDAARTEARRTASSSCGSLGAGRCGRGSWWHFSAATRRATPGRRRPLFVKRVASVEAGARRRSCATRQRRRGEQRTAATFGPVPRFAGASVVLHRVPGTGAPSRFLRWWAVAHYQIARWPQIPPIAWNDLGPSSREHGDRHGCQLRRLSELAASPTRNLSQDRAGPATNRPQRFSRADRKCAADLG